MRPNSLSAGAYVYVIVCPECHHRQETMITLTDRLTVDPEGGALAVRKAGKSVDHICGQRSTLDPPVDDVGTRGFDFAERAAGEHLDR